MQLLPVLPGTHTHLAQFSINLGCGSYQPANRCDMFNLRVVQRLTVSMLRLPLSRSFIFRQRESGVFYQPRSLLVSTPHRVSARALCWTPPTSQHRLLLWQLQRVRNLCFFWCIPPLTSNLNVSISFASLSRWTRISIPLPTAALTDATRFRWKQSGTVAGSMWAIDNGKNNSAFRAYSNIIYLYRNMQSENQILISLVYIGPACLRFCSGRGHCSRTGCK